jgi:Cytochrome P450
MVSAVVDLEMERSLRPDPLYLGPIVRIGPNELVTNDPNVLRRMSAVRSLYTRSEWYDGMRLEPEYDSMFSERNEERHNMLRSKAAMAVSLFPLNLTSIRSQRKYSGKDNKYLEKSIDDNIAKLVRLLDSKYASTTGFTPVDMAEKFQLLTLDIISEIAFGDAFGNLESDEDVSSYVETMENMFPLVILLGTWPALAKLFFWKPLRRFLPKETDAAGMGKFMGFVVPRLPPFQDSLDLTCLQNRKESGCRTIRPRQENQARHDRILARPRPFSKRSTD